MAIDTFLSGALGAFIAAWAGAYIGFRRGRKERALDRRIAWHEQAIHSLAEYEEQLERLRGHSMNALVIQRTKHRPNDAPPPSAEELPRLIQAPNSLWSALGAAEGHARAALRLGDLYTYGRTKVECSVALTNTVNMVAGHGRTSARNHRFLGSAFRAKRLPRRPFVDTFKTP